MMAHRQANPVAQTGWHLIRCKRCACFEYDVCTRGMRVYINSFHGRFCDGSCDRCFAASAGTAAAAAYDAFRLRVFGARPRPKE